MEHFCSLRLGKPYRKFLAGEAVDGTRESSIAGGVVVLVVD